MDVWNPKHLEPQNEPKSKQAMLNQQPMQNVATQNKAKLELIIFHLNMLRYAYIPKLNILQSMSTPKNWTCMLQILYFLALCWQVSLSYLKECFFLESHLKNLYFLILVST